MAYYSGVFGFSGHIREVSPIQGAGLEGFHCISVYMHLCTYVHMYLLIL